MGSSSDVGAGFERPLVVAPNTPLADDRRRETRDRAHEVPGGMTAEELTHAATEAAEPARARRIQQGVDNAQFGWTVTVSHSDASLC